MPRYFVIPVRSGGSPNTALFDEPRSGTRGFYAAGRPISCARSVTTRTQSSTTCKNPPSTLNRRSPSAVSTRKIPRPSTVINGACMARMPTSPSNAGATTARAEPLNNIFSGEITDTDSGVLTD